MYSSGKLKIFVYYLSIPSILKSNLNSSELNDSLLKNTHITVLSPNLLFLINCNEELFPEQNEVTIQNIQNLINKKEICGKIDFDFTLASFIK